MWTQIYLTRTVIINEVEQMHPPRFNVVLLSQQGPDATCYQPYPFPSVGSGYYRALHAEDIDLAKIQADIVREIYEH